MSALGLACLLILPGCGAPEPENVIVVLVDTVRTQNLGVYGYERDNTPRLAALAREGFLFEDLRSQAPCTYPSANSILTGRDGTHFWVQEGRRIGIPEGIPSLAEILGERGWSTAAVSASPIVRKSPSEHNPHGGFDRGFEIFDEKCLWNRASCVNDRALEHLESLPEPFLLYLHYMDPHDPYRPPSHRFSSPGFQGEPFVERGDPNPIAEGLYGEGSDADPPVSPSGLEHLTRLYDDEIAYFDERLGNLIDELSSRGLLERSILAVISDHGEEFLEHGHIKHCHTLYDTEIHTPMILRIPGARNPRRVSALAQNLDLVPTVLDYLGVETGLPLDGRSLRPLIESGTPVHDRVFSAYGDLRAVHAGDYKLLMNLRTEEVELYEMSSDPGETTDVAGRHPAKVRELQRALSRWIREVEGVSDREEALRRGEEAVQRLRALGYVE